MSVRRWRERVSLHVAQGSSRTKSRPGGSCLNIRRALSKFIPPLASTMKNSPGFLSASAAVIRSASIVGSSPTLRECPVYPSAQNASTCWRVSAGPVTGHESMIGILTSVRPPRSRIRGVQWPCRICPNKPHRWLPSRGSGRPGQHPWHRRRDRLFEGLSRLISVRFQRCLPGHRGRGMQPSWSQTVCFLPSPRYLILGGNSDDGGIEAFVFSAAGQTIDSASVGQVDLKDVNAGNIQLLHCS